MKTFAVMTLFGILMALPIMPAEAQVETCGPDDEGYNVVVGDTDTGCTMPWRAVSFLRPQDCDTGARVALPAYQTRCIPEDYVWYGCHGNGVGYYNPLGNRDECIYWTVENEIEPCGNGGVRFPDAPGCLPDDYVDRCGSAGFRPVPGGPCLPGDVSDLCGDTPDAVRSNCFVIPKTESCGENGIRVRVGDTASPCTPAAGTKPCGNGGITTDVEGVPERCIESGVGAGFCGVGAYVVVAGYRLPCMPDALVERCSNGYTVPLPSPLPAGPCVPASVPRVQGCGEDGQRLRIGPMLFPCIDPFPRVDGFRFTASEGTEEDEDGVEHHYYRTCIGEPCLVRVMTDTTYQETMYGPDGEAIGDRWSGSISIYAADRLVYSGNVYHELR